MKARMQSPVRRSAGFTLLEMLVVMILTAMVSTILMQALAQVFALDSRFGREFFNTQQGEMYREWFRQTVTGLMPEHADGTSKFKGQRREMSGLTIAPLDTASEALQPFEWHIAFDAASGQSELRYGRESAARGILSWEGNSGHFVYFDDKLASHDSWPPPLGGPWPQLPRAIHLEYRDSEGERLVVAVPKGPREPLPRMRDLLD